MQTNRRLINLHLAEVVVFPRCGSVFSLEWKTPRLYCGPLLASLARNSHTNPQLCISSGRRLSQVEVHHCAVSDKNAVKEFWKTCLVKNTLELLPPATFCWYSPIHSNVPRPFHRGKRVLLYHPQGLNRPVLRLHFEEVSWQLELIIQVMQSGFVTLKMSVLNLKWRYFIAHKHASCYVNMSIVCHVMTDLTPRLHCMIPAHCLLWGM